MANTQELLDAIGGMTVLELSEFVKAFEDKFGVTAAAPVAVAGPAGPAAVAAEPEEEKDEFDVVLTAAGEKKIQVIKEVRALTSLGLKEAKDLVDSAPNPVLEKVTKEAAEKAKEKLEAAGGSVALKEEHASARLCPRGRPGRGPITRGAKWGRRDTDKRGGRPCRRLRTTRPALRRAP